MLSSLPSQAQLVAVVWARARLHELADDLQRTIVRAERLIAASAWRARAADAFRHAAAEWRDELAALAATLGALRDALDEVWRRLLRGAP